jgi:hypothetical protein
MERLATLIGAGFGVGVAVDGLQRPLGILELHLLILVLLKIHLFFALPLTGRCAILARLLLLLMELFCELLHLSTLPHCGVWSYAPVIACHRHRCRMLDGGACRLVGPNPHQSL